MSEFFQQREHWDSCGHCTVNPSAEVPYFGSGTPGHTYGHSHLPSSGEDTSTLPGLGHQEARILNLESILGKKMSFLASETVSKVRI